MIWPCIGFHLRTPMPSFSIAPYIIQLPAAKPRHRVRATSMQCRESKMASRWPQDGPKMAPTAQTWPDMAPKWPLVVLRQQPAASRQLSSLLARIRSARVGVAGAGSLQQEAGSRQHPAHSILRLQCCRQQPAASILAAGCCWQQAPGQQAAGSRQQHAFPGLS